MSAEPVEPEPLVVHSRTTARRAGVVVAWIAATLLGLAVAATTRMGPILVTITADHGVHLGDLLAFAVAYAAALVITLSLLLGR
jgi:hypothetical protein